MPNWCYNTITFPTKKAYTDFIEQYGKGSRKFSYQWIIPEPKSPEECEEKYILHNDEERKAAYLAKDTGWFNWYDWHWDKWGCKWDAIFYDEDNCFDDEKFSICFDSPWSEPIKVYEKMAELGIEFSYTFVIEGDCWAGGGKSENGKLQCYKSEPPDVEDVPDEMPEQRELWEQDLGSEEPQSDIKPDSDNFPSDIPF